LNRRWSIVFVLFALAVVGIAWLVGKRGGVPPLVDRETVVEIEQISEESTYVGKQACRECHAENFRLHQQSGHASTFESTRTSPIAKRFADVTFDAGQPYGEFAYAVDKDGLYALNRGKFGEDHFPLQYVVGSGHHAVTLFSLIPDVEGGTVGIEHRVSWYASDDQLSITPGQSDEAPDDEAEFFGETIRGKDMHGCVFCHTTTGQIVGQEIVDLTPNVDCEKCHGPASEHVRLAKISDNPPPFSVGRDDFDAEAELQLCGSCHRLPKDMTAKQMRDYPNTVVRFQPVGLLRSECYLQSDGQLRCTTCHNPHMASKATPTAQHVKNCINCHQQDSETHVACPVSPAERCIECHMPAVKFAREIAFHDHWIRVRQPE
jgi:hypothetical protein